MKIYHFGAEDAPVLLLLPGTCCHWKSNFGAVIPLLADSFRVLCVSYDGFDETEQTEFPTMLEETEKIEAYLKTHCGGHIRAAYGCSLGGSFVGLLAARQNIHMDCGILGSSDLITPLPDKIHVPGTEICCWECAWQSRMARRLLKNMQQIRTARRSTAIFWAAWKNS